MSRIEDLQARDLPCCTTLVPTDSTRSFANQKHRITRSTAMQFHSLFGSTVIRVISQLAWQANYDQLESQYSEHVPIYRWFSRFTSKTSVRSPRRGGRPVLRFVVFRGGSSPFGLGFPKIIMKGRLTTVHIRFSNITDIS